MQTASTTDQVLPNASNGPRRLPALTLKWLHPIGTIVSYEMTFDLINRYSPSSMNAERGYAAGQAFETTGYVYTYFLEAIPPLEMVTGSFAVGEMTTEHLVDTWHQAAGRYFCVTTEWHGRDSLYQAWAALQRDIVRAR